MALGFALKRHSALLLRAAVETILDAGLENRPGAVAQGRRTCEREAWGFGSLDSVGGHAGESVKVWDQCLRECPLQAQLLGRIWSLQIQS